ncbi:hypothetical protein [Pseudomonas sp. NUPR-001]|uniref:hypothetical protein n=1 Tax=Pseudomonas sp. NUPR-001 TaxID=3416058 RepID=UPI003F9560BF
MNRQCLICESRAVMPRDAAKGLALLVGLIDGAAQRARSAPGACNRDMLMSGLAAITPTYPAALDAAEDVARFHFRGFDCLCLRCGALFDAAIADQESLNSS